MFPRLRTSLRPAHLPSPAPPPPSHVPTIPRPSFARSPRPTAPFSTSSARAAPKSGQQAKESRVRPFLYVLGFMPIFTFGLGTWQLQRLQWKLDMIDQLENKLHKDPVRLPAQIDPAAIPEFSYRKVYVTGVYDYENEIELGPRTRDGELGYHVVTPLVRGEGQDTILVNRGFVKRLKRDQKERPESLSKEPVEVVGMLRDQEVANSFTPDNNPEKGDWIFSNIEQMAKFTGAEPVLVDEIFTGHAGEIAMRLNRGQPIGRAATIHLRNQHMTYAITWYSLSAATAFMFFRLLKRPTRGLSAAELRGVARR